MARYEDGAFGLPDYASGDVQTDKEILAAMSPPPWIVGITIKAGSGKLASGTIMGRITSGGKYKQFDNGNSDGSEVPMGVLRSYVDASGTADRAGELIKFGVLKADQLVSASPGTIAEARAKDSAANPFYGCQYDSVDDLIVIG